MYFLEYSNASFKDNSFSATTNAAAQFNETISRKALSLPLNNSIIFFALCSASFPITSSNW